LKVGGRFHFSFAIPEEVNLEVNLMRSLLNSALVVSLLCASSAAQTAQTSSPKSRKISAQKPGAGREITPQQERAISVLNNLFERTK
jgi:hypothetical protein